MKNYKKHIDDFFREKLGRYRETPPDDVWDSLQGKLDTLKPYVPTSPFRWMWHFGMVSLITVLSVSLTRKFTNKPADAATKEVAVTATPATANDPTAVTPAGEQSAAQQNTVGTASEAISVPSDASGTPGGNAAPLAAGKAQDRINGGTSVVRAHNTNSGIKATGIKENTTQQYLASATPATRAKNTTQNLTTRNGAKESYKQQKTTDAFNSNSSIAQLSAVLNNEEANNKSELAGKPSQAPTNTPPGLAAAPVKNVKKEALPEIKKTTLHKVAEKKSDKPAIKRFDFGVKAGYEQGSASSAATKWVVAPYLQYHVAPKVSLMVQPGIKYATISQRNIGKAQNYYSINGDGQQVVQNGPTVIDSIKVISSNVDTYYHTNYRYTQSHDSIVKTKTLGGSYVEFELPILLQYNISRHLSVYGGVNLLFSRRTVVTENTYIKTGIQRTMDSTVYGTGTPTGLSAPHMSNIFTYSGNPYSDYQNPGVYPMKQENMLRIGYMLGLSYEYSNRWLFDALIQQSPLRPDLKDGYNLNSSLSSPYFRLSVGYKLTK